MSISHKVAKGMLLVIGVYIAICLITPYSKTLRSSAIRCQISYLSDLLEKGYDDKLQSRYPEGKIFSNALLALSVIEFCDNYKVEDSKYAKIVDRCINRMDSPAAKQYFHKEIVPSYGVFYSGWCNLVYASYSRSSMFKNSQIQGKVLQQSEMIGKRIGSSMQDSISVLPSYAGACWPADNIIGIASLTDRKLASRWLAHLKKQSKHKSGLVHHSCNDQADVRGSSSAMITYGISLFDMEKGQRYNEKFQRTLVDNYLGIQLVREHLEAGSADYDSGPILWGYGASATIMNVKSQAILGSSNIRLTWGLLNLIGLPLRWNGNKYYLLKKEPMFDLFMLWAIASL